MGRHHAAAHAAPVASRPHRRRWWLVLGVLLVVMLVVGVWRIVDSAARPRCGSPTTYTVAADPTLVDLAELEGRRAADSCTAYQVEAVADDAMPARLAGGGAVPDLWLAPSREQADTVGTRVGRQLPSMTVASSPIVLAGAQTPAPKTWLDALSGPNLHAVSSDSPYVDSPLIVGVAESGTSGANEQALTAALVHLAQSAQPVSGEPVSAAAKASGTVIVPESAYLAAKKSDPSVAAVVPDSGTTLDRIPLVVTAAGGRTSGATAAGQRLAAQFMSRDGAADIAAAGLRGPDGNTQPAGGVGAVRLLPEPDAAQLAAAEKALTTVAIPLKTLVVVEISGSMADKVGDTTRIGIAVAGFDRVVSQISDQNQIGLWAYSLSRSGQDWVSLVPTAALGDKRGSVTQRAALMDAIATLPARVAGGTGLYSTTLAAFKEAQRLYDPAFSNSVILLTDGADADHSGPTLDSLLSQLKSLQDPARPITINPVGISAQPDMGALQQIAAVTDGTAQRADSEQQMSADFVTAVARRTAH